MKREWYTAGDLAAIVVITILALGVGYVCFALLYSYAEGVFEGVQVGGALAGTLAALSLLGSLYMQFRKSSIVVRDLRIRNQELMNKILRGSPAPPNYDAVVSERNRLVLAKPVGWVSRGGTLFDFGIPADKLRKGDRFPGRLRVTYLPTESEAVSTPRDRFYNRIEANFRSLQEAEVVSDLFCERFHLGNPEERVPSLKVGYKAYAVTYKRTRPATQREELIWRLLSNDERAIISRTISKANGALLDKGETDTVALSQEEQVVTAETTNSVDSSLPGRTEGEEGPADAPAVTTVAEEGNLGCFASSKKDVSKGESGYVLAWRELGVRKVVMQVSFCEVWSYNEELEKVFSFQIADDIRDFPASSEVFNIVLESVRFLPKIAH